VHRIREIIRLLIASYGDKIWHKKLDPVGELVQTILSQNTSDINSHRAYASLIGRFRNWRKVASADLSQIADTIRCGGLADIKAVYIKSALTTILEKNHSFDLQFLNQLSVNDARSWLMQLPGVGMITASCVLLFSLGMPAFPVDTHVLRVTKRLGLLPANISADSAHIELERLINPGDIYRGHMLFIEHGRKICKARSPLCNNCNLISTCPSAIIVD